MDRGAIGVVRDENPWRCLCLGSRLSTMVIELRMRKAEGGKALAKNEQDALAADK